MYSLKGIAIPNFGTRIPTPIWLRSGLIVAILAATAIVHISVTPASQTEAAVPSEISDTARLQQRGMKRPNLETITTRIEAAVAAGRLTAEQAEVKLSQLQKRSSSPDGAQSRLQQQGMKRPNLETITTRIEAAVAAGRLTAEQAEVKLSQVRTRHDADAKSNKSETE